MLNVYFIHQIESWETTLKTEEFGVENVSSSLKSALIRTGEKGKKEKETYLKEHSFLKRASGFWTNLLCVIAVSLVWG